MNRIINIFLLIVLLSASFPGPVQAQRMHHDVSFSYGLLTSDQVFGTSVDMTASTVSLGAIKREDYRFSGGLFLTYKYHASYRVWLGASFGSDKTTGDLIFLNNIVGDFEKKFRTFAFEGSYHYSVRESFRLYSGLGIGYTFGNEVIELDNGNSSEQDLSHLGIHLNFIGFRFGKTLGGFVELGLGYKGVLSFGLSYQF